MGMYYYIPIYSLDINNLGSESKPYSNQFPSEEQDTNNYDLRMNYQ